jgi:DNA-directed RNA polymerase specialized sigma24 family protein
MCAFDHLPRSEVEELIRQWIRSERDRAIVSRKWLDGLTFERVSEEFDLSVRQVQTIVRRSADIIRAHSS